MAKVRRNRKSTKGSHLWTVVLAAALAAALAGGSVLFALRYHVPESHAESDPVSVTEPTSPVRTLPKAFIDLNTFSPYIVLKDITNDRVLYSKAADTKCYPASLTKLVTALVATEVLTPETEITVGTEIRLIDPYSSRANLTVGMRMTFEQLMQAMLLPSGNDAAYAMAACAGRLLAGNENLTHKEAIAFFCGKMNEKAQALGCTGTHFVNPDGIHDAAHFTTAADMTRIAAAVLENDLIARTVATPEVNDRLLSGETVHWQSSNRLIRPDNLYTYEGATGMKTGSTKEAGNCLIASATLDGRTCVAVMMGAEKDSDRWDDATGLLDLCFQ